MADDIKTAKELRGVHCPSCGGTLVVHRSRAYCDWCDTYPRPEHDSELQSDDPEVDELIADLERQRRRRGHRA